MHRILLTLNLWISRILSYYTVHLERWKCKILILILKRKRFSSPASLFQICSHNVSIHREPKRRKPIYSSSLDFRQLIDFKKKRKEKWFDKKDRFNREEMIQCVVQVNIRSDFIKNNFTIIQIILKSPCLIFMSRFPFRYPTTLVWNCKTADALLWANLF